MNPVYLAIGVLVLGYAPDAWLRALAYAGYAAAAGFSRLQSGLLARYAFGSLLAVAVILLVRVAVR